MADHEFEYQYSQVWCYATWTDTSIWRENFNETMSSSFSTLGNPCDINLFPICAFFTERDYVKNMSRNYKPYCNLTNSLVTWALIQYKDVILPV